MRASKQQGVALITALIITSIAVSVATMIIYRQQIQIRLSSNINTLEQNYQYAYGMEDFAGTILRRSFEDQPEFVSLNDPWYSETGLVLPIEGGQMVGKLYDLQARINLNSLIRPKTERPGQNDESNPIPEEEKKYDDIAQATHQRLSRLMTALDPQEQFGPPVNFPILVKDWIDKDSNNGNSADEAQNDNYYGSGAETPYYQTQEPAYYSANTEMISPTELRLLKDMKESFYRTLSPEVSTLPTLNGKDVTQTPVNVNTASKNVLFALGFDPNAVSEIITTRTKEPFKTLDEFKQLDVVSSVLSDDGTQREVNPLGLDVKSSYFLLEGTVEINNTRLFINSVLWRDPKGQVSVIMRDFSNPKSIVKTTTDQ